MALMNIQQLLQEKSHSLKNQIPKVQYLEQLCNTRVLWCVEYDFFGV